MGCDQCSYEREIHDKLVDEATIGCFRIFMKSFQQSPNKWLRCEPPWSGESDSIDNQSWLSLLFTQVPELGFFTLEEHLVITQAIVISIIIKYFRIMILKQDCATDTHIARRFSLNTQAVEIIVKN